MEGCDGPMERTEAPNNWYPPSPTFEGRTKRLTLLGPPLRKAKTRRKAPGYWQKKENCREFLSEFAAEMGFDPTVAANWELVTAKQVAMFKVTRQEGSN